MDEEEEEYEEVNMNDDEEDDNNPLGHFQFGKSRGRHHINLKLQHMVNSVNMNWEDTPPTVDSFDFDLMDKLFAFLD